MIKHCALPEIKSWLRHWNCVARGTYHRQSDEWLTTTQIVIITCSSDLSRHLCAKLKAIFSVS